MSDLLPAFLNKSGSWLLALILKSRWNAHHALGCCHGHLGKWSVRIHPNPPRIQPDLPRIIMFSHCSINPTCSITVYTLEGESTWMHRKYIIVTYMHQPQSHKTWVEIHTQPYLHVQYSRYSHRFHEYQWNIPIWCRTGISASISRSANGLALVTVCTTTVGNVMCWSKNMYVYFIYTISANTINMQPTVVYDSNTVICTPSPLRYAAALRTWNPIQGFHSGTVLSCWNDWGINLHV